MRASEALLKRKSVRAFTQQQVSPNQVKDILQCARHAPSGVNTQPWHVAVVMDKAKQRLQNRVIAAVESGEKSSIEYQYYPGDWTEPYYSRRKECGLLMYSTLNIGREDKERQRSQWVANYRAFDAPVMLLFFIDKSLAEGSYMDYGMFLQSVMLAAVDQGLATCPQASLAEYPHIVKDELSYDDSQILLCGMALGYEDKDALVNTYRTPREEVDRFSSFFQD